MGARPTKADGRNAVDALMALGRAQTTSESGSPALFICSESSSVPDEDVEYQYRVDRVPKARVEVRVPAIKNPTDYRMYAYDPRVRRILDQHQTKHGLLYSVEKADGTHEKVRHLTKVGIASHLHS